MKRNGQLAARVVELLAAESPLTVPEIRERTGASRAVRDTLVRLAFAGRVSRMQDSDGSELWAFREEGVGGSETDQLRSEIARLSAKVADLKKRLSRKGVHGRPKYRDVGQEKIEYIR